MIQKYIKSQVKKHKLCSLVLPEAADPRVLSAACSLAQEQLASRIILLGDPVNIEKQCQAHSLTLPRSIIVYNHLQSNDIKSYAQEYYESYSRKGVTQEIALETIKDPVYYGMYMVRDKRVDTCVCGSIATTATVLRATLRIIGLQDNVRTLSSFFLMITHTSFGDNGTFLFADAGAVPDPNAEQLAQIAISTADTAKLLLPSEPKVAMLSFSTKGSAQHRLTLKVVKATELVKNKRPDIKLDGELQADTAIVPEVAAIKLKESPVAGAANVLIFPDLNSGNICYKLVERLAGAHAFGPIIQGTKFPISDLSRGCSSDDIVNVSIISLLRAAMTKK